jgi:hypothetical protein
VACDAGDVGASGSGVTLPARRPANGFPAALFEGQLQRDGRCVYGVPIQGERELIIWPPGALLIDDAVVVDGGRFPLGSRVRIGGGEYNEKDYDFLRTLLANDVAPECRGGPYWYGSEVRPSP